MSMANSISMALVALTIPAMGVLSDRSRRRTPYLFGLTATNLFFTALIGVIGLSGLPLQAKLVMGIVAFIAANWAYQGALPFYNSLLPQVTQPHRYGKVSGLGVSLGYVGAILGLLLVMPFNEGQLLNWDIPFIPGWGREATFLPTSLFFALFSIPTFVVLWERKSRISTPKVSLRKAYSQLWETLRDSQKYPGILRFLVAKYFYEDGIQTAIIFMAVYAEKVMGFPDSVKIPFFIVATMGATIGSYLGGFIVDKRGAKNTLQLVLIGWVLALVILVIIQNRYAFWILGCLIGALMGCVWTSARPLLIQLSPPDCLGRFFGLYALSGKVAAISGPIIWGLVVKFLSPYGDQVRYKAAVGALGIMILTGWLIIRKVPDISYSIHYQTDNRS